MSPEREMTSLEKGLVLSVMRVRYCLSPVSGDDFRLDSIRAEAKFVIAHPCNESSSIPVLDIAEGKS
eukprot:4432320-Ditylum_brightwellii.AAC.1